MYLISNTQQNYIFVTYLKLGTLDNVISQYLILDTQHKYIFTMYLKLETTFCYVCVLFCLSINLFVCLLF